MSITRRVLGGLTLAAAVAAAPLPANAQDAGSIAAADAKAADAKAPVVVFAAASLKNALDAIAKGWTKESGVEVRVSYAASSALARQIEQAAPADLFISADLAWMDYVDKKDLVTPGTRVDLLGNRLVLVAGPGWSKGDVELKPGVDLAGLLGDERLAMGEPNSAPAGKYGKAALETLGAWDKVSSKVAGAENVRAAPTLVSRGEAPLGIVYKTDAAADAGVRIVGIFPADSHPPIVYPAARLKAAASPSADAFLKRLSSGSARRSFEEAGFAMIAPPSGS